MWLLENIFQFLLYITQRTLNVWIFMQKSVLIFIIKFIYCDSLKSAVFKSSFLDAQIHLSDCLDSAVCFVSTRWTEHREVFLSRISCHSVGTSSSNCCRLCSWLIAASSLTNSSNTTMLITTLIWVRTLSEFCLPASVSPFFSLVDGFTMYLFEGTKM